jgi:hypothetical protein
VDEQRQPSGPDEYLDAGEERGEGDPFQLLAFVT